MSKRKIEDICEEIVSKKAKNESCNNITISQRLSYAMEPLMKDESSRLFCNVIFEKLQTCEDINHVICIIELLENSELCRRLRREQNEIFV